MVLLWKSPVNNCVIYVTYFKIPRFYQTLLSLYNILRQTKGKFKKNQYISNLINAAMLLEIIIFSLFV